MVHIGLLSNILATSSLKSSKRSGVLPRISMSFVPTWRTQTRVLWLMHWKKLAKRVEIFLPGKKQIPGTMPATWDGMWKRKGRIMESPASSISQSTSGLSSLDQALPESWDSFDKGMLQNLIAWMQNESNRGYMYVFIKTMMSLKGYWIMTLLKEQLHGYIRKNLTTGINTWSNVHELLKLSGKNVRKKVTMGALKSGVYAIKQ